MKSKDSLLVDSLISPVSSTIALEEIKPDKIAKMTKTGHLRQIKEKPPQNAWFKSDTPHKLARGNETAREPHISRRADRSVLISTHRPKHSDASYSRSMKRQKSPTRLKPPAEV